MAISELSPLGESMILLSTQTTWGCSGGRGHLVHLSGKMSATDIGMDALNPDFTAS